MKSRDRIPFFLSALIVARLATLIPKAFLPFTLPETWRQSVTLGVAMRFWNRWAHGDFSFLPAVLDSANGNGIMPMETPVLNILFAPFFAFGPYWGKVGACIAMSVLQFLLLLLAAKVWKKKLGPSLLLLPFVSFTFGWFGKFTPDLVSVLLTLIGVGLVVEDSKKEKKIFGSFLVFLGVLIKPTSIALLAFSFFSEKKVRAVVSRGVVFFTLPVLFAALYYLKVNPYIETLRTTPGQFPIQLKGPADVLLSLLANPLAYFRVFWTRLFNPYSLIPLAAVFCLAWKDWTASQIWKKILLIFCLQVFVLSYLSADHVFDHEYYFMPLAPIACFVFYEAGIWLWAAGRNPKSFTPRILAIALALLFIVPNLEAVWIEYKPLIRGSQEVKEPAECAELIRRNPQIPFHQEYPFRSTPQAFTILGLCFGEREMSTQSAWGFYRLNERIPSDCKPVDHGEYFQLVSCPGS